MVAISVKYKSRELERGLDSIQRRQVPFATSQALNDTAADGMKFVRFMMPRHLDRPTPFTVKGILFGRSNKRNLTSFVFVKSVVWRYLKYQILGGTRINRGGVAVPARGKKLNKYGNIPGKRTGLVKGKDYLAKKGRILGVWRDKGKKKRSQLQVLIADKATYRPILPFKKLVKRVVDKRFVGHWNKRMKAALRTAR